MRDQEERGSGPLQQFSADFGEQRPKKKKKKKRGPYWYGEGYTALSDEIDRREYIWGLSPAEVLTLVLFTRDVQWKKTLYVEAAWTYMARKVGVSLKTMERLLAKDGQLRVRGFIRLHKRGERKKGKGSIYFVEPVLIWSSKWNVLEGIALSRCLQGTLPRRTSEEQEAEGATRQNDGKDSLPVKMTVSTRQNDGKSAASLVPTTRQNVGEISQDLTGSNGAQRHSSVTTAGGVADPGEKVSFGQIRTAGEGVALPGDDITPWSEEWRRAVDEADAKAEAQRLARAEAERLDLVYREEFKALHDKHAHEPGVLAEKLDELAKRCGKETHFARHRHSKPRPQKPVGKGGRRATFTPVFPSGGKR